LPKILVTAEPFGFGPASKLHAIVTELADRNFDCHFIGRSSSLTFMRCNGEPYSSITELKDLDELAALGAHGFDAALSVMDPNLVAWASAHRVPCLYVDSLFWFWPWPAGRQAGIRETVSRLASTTDPAQALEIIGSLPMHDSQLAAHMLSTSSCVQRAPGTAERTQLLRDVAAVVEVDGIVDLSHRSPARPRVWLATCSGMVNSLLPLRSALDWVRISCALIEEAGAALGTRDPVILAGNPEVLRFAGDIASARIQPTPMSSAEMLGAMNYAFACLTPPGLTTMLESAAYGLPLILLPEQHYGHRANFHRIAAGEPGVYPNGLLGPEVGSNPHANQQLDETLVVAEELKMHFSAKDAVWTRMIDGLADGMRRAMNDRASLAALQERSIRRVVGGFEGTSQVAKAMESIVTGV
jgi:hypothetical protein